MFQLLLATVAILPEARAELTAVGASLIRWESPALTQAFGTGAWVALGVLGIALIASFRFTGEERDTDAHLVGLILLFLTAPLLWAGTFAHQIASASALRWGLSVAFVVGSAVMAARTPLRVALHQLGFPLHPTWLTRPVLLAMLAVAAGVVVFLSAQVAELGLSGRKPSGPVAESIFAMMGAIPSNLVPLALVVLGLAGTAARERSAGYAFAGGLVFVATIAAGYALGVVTAGGVLDATEQVRIWLLACGGAAVWALAWLAAEPRVTGGPLLAIQSRLGLFLLAWGALAPVVLLLVQPDTPLKPAASVFGQFGWLALALAAAAGVWRALRSEPGLKFHALALAAVIAAAIAACAVQPWDEGNGCRSTGLPAGGSPWESGLSWRPAGWAKRLCGSMASRQRSW